MRFDRWHRLEDAATTAPQRPGVFQVRLEEGLVRYPRGRAAMIHYGAGSDLQADLLAFAQMHAGQPWLVRVTRDPVDDPPARLQRLLADFCERFGAAPHPPGPAET